MTPTTLDPVLDAPPRRRSLGHQFVEADGFDFFRRGGHKHSGAWTAPPIVVAADVDVTPASIITSGGLTLGQVEPMRARPTLPTVASLLAQGRTTANAILFPYEVTPNALLKFAATAEAAAKATMTLGTLQLWTAPVTKAAGIVPVTEEQFDDIPGLVAYIDSRLARAADLAVDADLLAQIAALPGLTAPYVKAQSNAAALLAQACKVFVASGYIPDAIVLHPAALWGTLTLAGQELVGADTDSVLSMSNLYLYGMRLVPSPIVPDPTIAYVGAFGTAGQIFWRDEFAIEVSNSHVDTFIKNTLTLRGERRYAFASYCNPAFGTVTGLTVLT